MMISMQYLSFNFFTSANFVDGDDKPHFLALIISGPLDKSVKF